MKIDEITDDFLKVQWDRLGNIPVNDDGLIDEDFAIYELDIRWPKGTDREEIWEWFEMTHSKGIRGLMNILVQAEVVNGEPRGDY